MQIQYLVIIDEDSTTTNNIKHEKLFLQSKQHSKAILSKDMTLSLSKVIQGTMLMMPTVLAFFCYIACYTNKYVCTWKKFPDISHVMGRPPLN